MFNTYLTSRDGGERWAPQQVPAVGLDGDVVDGAPHATADLPVVFVDPGRRFQVIDGFGGAFTEAAAITWQALAPADQQQVLRDYFDPLHGHGYTFCRVHINSCDFALGNYAHADMPGDVALHSFSIQRDQQALLPFIQAALRAAGQCGCWPARGAHRPG